MNKTIPYNPISQAFSYSRDNKVSTIETNSGAMSTGVPLSIERFSIAFTANGKRQAEISLLPKTCEIYLVSVYILPVSHSYGASTKNREIS